MVNKFAAACNQCGNTVPANGGTVRKVGRRWIVNHLACADGPQVIGVTFNSGHTAYRNVHGVCEDAPCCGCCSY